MDKSEVMNFTDIETITAVYEEVMGEALLTDGTHTLFNRGVYTGMEVLATAIAKSMTARKLLQEQPPGE